MDFYEIALAKFYQSYPELGSLVLTFQDITDQLTGESNTKVGVIVLRSGPELFYVPIVSKNEDIHPIDSIFFDEKKKFFPLTKRVISKVLAPGQTEQGKATKIPPTVVGNPSTYGLITPPRTGKYAYASSSRLTEFLAGMPNNVKQDTLQKFASEKSLYDDLDAMYGLKAIFDVLKPTPQGAAAKVNEAPISMVTGAGPKVSADDLKAVLEKGYAFIGAQQHPRVALSVQNYNQTGTVRTVSAIDADRDYEIAFRNGPSREAFIPKMHRLNRSVGSLAIFTNGDYADADHFVSVGDALERKKVLTRLFDYNPPVLLRDLNVHDRFVLITNSGQFLGPFSVNKIALSNLGVEIRVIGGRINTICGYTNFLGEAEVIPGKSGDTLYIPSNTIVIKLAANVSPDLERSQSQAAMRKEFETLQHLGAEINLGYDGVEYTIDGRPVGTKPKVMEILVIKEGIAPDQAENFVKQAEQTKFTKIYLSKKASVSGDYAPADIPTYGAIPQDSPSLKPNGAYNKDLVQNVQKSMPLKDGQVTESVIISELLQTADMFGQIEEYLPDIEECIDKLGRILFMSRVHIDQISKVTDSESVFGFLSQVKAVYRMLGDNYVRLLELCNGSKAVVDNGVESE